MANNPSKTSMPIATSTFSKLNLSGQHVTTSNFMEFGVAKYLHVMPNQSIPTKHTTFALFDPIATPTMGRATIHNKCFFVPMRTIFPAFDDMITDTIHTYADGTTGHPTYFPYVRMSTLRQFFLDGIRYRTSELVTDDNISDDNCDIVAILQGDLDNPFVIKRYNLTFFGRRAMKLLNQLGIKVDFNELANDYYVNILAILAMIKIYMDYYFPSAYIQTEQAQRVYSLTTRDVNDENMELINDPQQLFDIFDVVNKVNYDNDFFANCWDNPSGPNLGAFTDISINDITTGNGEIGTDFTQYNTPTANGAISHYLLKALRSVSDYMERHKMVGSRALDRFLSRFGIALSSEKLKRSVLIDDFTQDITFGDIMSTADTTGANLGTRAGRGHSYDHGYYDYKTRDYGIIMWISTVIPKHGYYQGMDRHNLAMTKLDLWTPEFDALGAQAVSTMELYLPMNAKKMYPKLDRLENNFDNMDYSQASFGFGPMYYHDKLGRDNITGDFVLGSKNTGLQGYTLMRDLDAVFDENGMFTVHDLAFVQGDDSSQYNRMFYNTSRDMDHIKLFHNFEIDSTAPCKRLYDNYEFENEDVSQHLSVDVNGVKAN